MTPQVTTENGSGSLFDKFWSRKLIVFGAVSLVTIINGHIGRPMSFDEWKILVEFAGKYLIVQGAIDLSVPVIRTIVERAKQPGSSVGPAPSGKGN